MDSSQVYDLKPVSFKCKSNGVDDIGLIAEEVAEVIPDLVVFDVEGRPDAVKYDRVPVYLIEAIRDLKAENDQLRRRIELLEEATGVND